MGGVMGSRLHMQKSETVKKPRFSIRYEEVKK
jgi:hypothetical protein